MKKVLRLLFSLAFVMAPFTSINATEGTDVQLKSVRTDAENWLNGETIGLYCQLYNAGTTTISSVKLYITIGDEYTTAIDKTLSLASGKSSNLYVDLPIDGLQTGVNKLLSVEVAEVNGSVDADADNNTAECTISVADNLYPRNVVVEEGTGTWCGWCVKGIVALKTLSQDHPDDFIAIAVHNNDDLTVKEYTEGQNQKSYPFAIVDRTLLDLSASAATLESAYHYEKENRALADLEMAADWNSDSTAFDVALSATFGYTGTDVYNLAFVVIEDSVTGYTQENYYSGGENGEMGGFENMDETVEIPMNHVARSIYPSYNGDIYFMQTESGVKQQLALSVPLPSTVQRTNHLSLVALLMDNSDDRRIINAKCVALSAGKTIDNPFDPNDNPNSGDDGKTVIDNGKGDANGYQYVDMGLSTMWAYSNMLGSDENFGQAASPEIYGGYFGWADPTGTLTSTEAADYIPQSNPEEISGSEYDIAHQKWNGSWRLPSHDEWVELIDNCNTEASELNGVKGLLFTSKLNNATLFLPMNGTRYGTDVYDQSLYGAYWTGTRCLFDLGDGQTYIYEIDFDDYGPNENGVDNASTGMGVRPVFTKANTSIQANIADNNKSVHTEYYNIAGSKVQSDAKGILIKRMIYSNGQSRSVKFISK